MIRALHLKLLYALASASFFSYWTVKLFSIPAADRNPDPMAAVYCLMLFAAVPSAGYVLLFKIVPWIGRILRKL